MRQILFKYPEMQREFAAIHPKAMDVIDYMSETAWTLWKELLVCTCIVRYSKITEKDTHYRQAKPYRFIDFACLTKGDTERLRQMVNREFEYDSARPGLDTIPPLDHGTASHIHTQVMP